MSLTPEQVQTIKATVPVLQEHGATITTTFYDNLLRENPELNNIFNNANQRTRHQPRTLAGALYAYASHIDDLGALTPAVELMCQRHASLFIKPDHYQIVGKYLLAAMGEVLGSALTKEILDAWAAAYWQLANLMIGREEQIYQEVDEWRDWRDFRIADKVKESDQITSFYLKPVDGKPLPAFKPGQYISVMMDVPEFNGYMQARQYSLSDAQKSDYYRVSVKKEDCLKVGTPSEPLHPGWISNVMHDHKNISDIIKLSRPAGEFFLEPEQDKDVPVVLLSAGVGVTPMICILNTLVERGSTQPISFVHGARTTPADAFCDHVRKIASEHPNVRTKLFIKNPAPETDREGVHYHHAGRLSFNKLDKEADLFADNPQTKYFVCGPEGFYGDVEKALVAMGVDESRIKTEKFGNGEVTK
jgi:nitric oxide dioxygenase